MWKFKEFRFYKVVKRLVDFCVVSVVNMFNQIFYNRYTIVGVDIDPTPIPAYAYYDSNINDACKKLINYIDKHKPSVLYLGMELYLEMQKYNRCTERHAAPSYNYYFVEQRIKFILDANINIRDFCTEAYDPVVISRLDDL